jgi:citrate lyase subunit beta/citryl-CoA lyase
MPRMPDLDPSFLLFVPGDRPDRFEKAARSAASGAILDLEDAVAPAKKDAARVATARYLSQTAGDPRVVVRINALGTPWFADDCAMVAAARIPALLVPKAGAPGDLDAVIARCGEIAIVALIESAAGVVNAAAIAKHPACAALAFGPYDLAADLGGSDDRVSMHPHRAHVAVAARAAGVLALDGPSAGFDDPARVEDDARYARRLGFEGKLLIHPAQIAPARSGFAPGAEEIARAERIVAAAEAAMPAVLDGAMIDAPMLAAARRTIARRAG